VAISSVTWVVNFFHVLFGSLWLGGAVYASAVAGPLLGSVPGEAGALVAGGFAESTARFFRISGGLAILLGLAVSWLEGRFGPLSWAALIVALALFGWGEAVVRKRAAAVMGASDADRPAAIRAVMQASLAENAGFLVLLWLMVALRYAG
jgi:hypothetical protein